MGDVGGFLFRFAPAQAQRWWGKVDEGAIARQSLGPS